MSQARIAAVAALAGAAGMLAVSGAPVQLFLMVAELITESPKTASFAGQMLFGTVCATLFAAGMIAAACHLIQPTSMARSALVCGAIAFGIALLSIGWGNTRVALTFSQLAQAETVQPEPYTRGCQSALLPMRLGYALVLAASGFLLLAVFTTPTRKDSRRSALGTVALIVTILASLLLVTANGFAALHARRFDGLLTPAARVDPTRLAASLSGIVLGIYAVSLALAGLGLACLLLALSPVGRAAKEVAQLSDGGRDLLDRRRR